MQSKNQFSLKRIEPTSFVFSKQKMLGKGAFGEVFLGFDEKNRIPVAIKTISSSRASQSHINEQALAQKIVGELSNMQLARNERLVKLISPHQSAKNMYLVCQFCNGGSLKEYLNKKGILSETEALCFLKDILQCFRSFHEKKIVHRDLKPANMLLHNHRIKIGDLGFSKSLQMHEQLLTSIVGSPLYMSPQILNNSNYTENTDIWSLGIIMYEMLVGEAPWRVNSIQQIKQKVRYKPQFPKNITFSNETKSLILSMLQYEQKNRISWQKLFQEYLHEQSSAMQNQQAQTITRLKHITEHFLLSISIQSQPHIIKMLIKNNKQYHQPSSTCSTAKQYFHKLKNIKEQQAYIESYINLYIENRNYKAYLIKLFTQFYSISEHINSPLVYTSMFMIIKYAIANTQQYLQTPTDNTQNSQAFVNSFYYQNLKQLLLLDLELLQQLNQIYFHQIFVPKIKQFPQNIGHQIEKDLKCFFNDQSASLKFTQFWLETQFRLFFNHFKTAQQPNKKLLFILRLIYEYEKKTKTHILSNMGQKSNICKKIENWEHDEKWKIKIKQIKVYEIESVTSFINRQIQWKQINLLKFPINNYSME